VESIGNILGAPAEILKESKSSKR